MRWASINWFWPKLREPEVRIWAAREGTLAALTATVLCLLDARDESLFLVPAVVFLVLAIAIWRMSLLAAALGFLLCVANLIAGLVFSLQMSAADYEGFSKVLWIVNGALALAFLNAMRSIVADRRLTPRATPP